VDEHFRRAETPSRLGNHNADLFLVGNIARQRVNIGELLRQCVDAVGRTGQRHDAKSAGRKPPDNG
jgi:hypothetical protein